MGGRKEKKRIAETLASTVIFPPHAAQENSESGRNTLIEKERERIELLEQELKEEFDLICVVGLAEIKMP